MCAAIDKTYLKYQDYLILKDWCDKTELIYDNGVKGSPKDFLFSYNEPYEGEAPVWNTPESFDRWLYYNCPLSFIQERLREQYSDTNTYFNQKIVPIPETGTRYSGSFNPKYRTNYIWFIEFEDYGWYYGWNSKTWYDYNTLMPPETCNCGHTTIKNLTKRKLNRLIKKWKLPIGTKLEIMCYGTGEKFKITIKK